MSLKKKTFLFSFFFLFFFFYKLGILFRTLNQGQQWQIEIIMHPISVQINKSILWYMNMIIIQ